MLRSNGHTEGTDRSNAAVLTIGKIIIFAPLQGAKLNLIINYHARADDLEQCFL